MKLSYVFSRRPLKSLEKHYYKIYLPRKIYNSSYLGVHIISTYLNVSRFRTISRAISWYLLLATLDACRGLGVHFLYLESRLYVPTDHKRLSPTGALTTCIRYTTTFLLPFASVYPYMMTCLVEWFSWCRYHWGPDSIPGLINVETNFYILCLGVWSRYRRCFWIP